MLQYNKIILLQEIKFGPRKRGSNTIPAKIFHEYQNTFDITTEIPKNNYFVNFYRIPSIKIFKPNLLFTYSKSKMELIKTKQFSEKLNYHYLKNNDKIYSNGFYYSKYFGMKYYPRYFFKLTIDSKLSIVNYQSKSYKYGIYIRQEYNDIIILNNYIKSNNISKQDILIFGKKLPDFNYTFDQNIFFNSFDIYLLNNASYDCVSNTLLEALYYDKKILVMNQFAIANDNKDILKAYFYFGKINFFKKLQMLNEFGWKNLNTENFKKRSEIINNNFKKSKSFIDFLSNF